MIVSDDFVNILDAITLSFSQGKFEAGDSLFSKHVSEFPESIRLECLGNRHFYKREMQDSIRCYEAAILLSPDRVIPRYQYLVGVEEEREGNFIKAFERYQAAIEAAPSFVDSYVELGGLLVKVNDFEGAAHCYRDAIRIEPNNVANYLNLKAVLSHLSITDSDRYKVELGEIERICEKLAQSDASQLSGRYHW